MSDNNNNDDDGDEDHDSEVFHGIQLKRSPSDSLLLSIDSLNTQRVPLTSP